MTHRSGWHVLKLAGALCAGAFVGALAAALILVVVEAIPQGAATASMFVPSNLLFAYFVFWFTAPVALAVGVPSYYLLRRQRMLNAVSVAAVGIAAGAGMAMLLKAAAPSSAELYACAGIGLVSALAAFLHLPRQDRSANG